VNTALHDSWLFDPRAVEEKLSVMAPPTAWRHVVVALQLLTAEQRLVGWQGVRLRPAAVDFLDLALVQLHRISMATAAVRVLPGNGVSDWQSPVTRSADWLQHHLDGGLRAALPRLAEVIQQLTLELSGQSVADGARGRPGSGEAVGDVDHQSAGARGLLALTGMSMTSRVP
jgi:hypothetical protein